MHFLFQIGEDLGHHFLHTSACAATLLVSTGEEGGPCFDLKAGVLRPVYMSMVFSKCNKISEMKMLYRRHVPAFHVRMTKQRPGCKVQFLSARSALARS